MMLKNILYQLYALLHFLPGFGQKMSLQTIAELPEDLPECSGMALLPSGHLAMINDSGNPPEIFVTDKSGLLLKKVELPFAENHDWEDLTFGGGHLFVGDFGNNRNNREDLTIYRVGVGENDSLFDDGKISFSYARQKDFPPDERTQNYDLEAMAYANDSLFLFSKNRTQPFTGYTLLYGLPATPGNYELTPLDSFKTGEGLAPAFWVTSADFNPRSKTLVLLGYDKMWAFIGFSGHHFFKGKSKMHPFKELSQKEAVTFAADDSLLITDERADSFGGGYLYKAFLETQDFLISITPKEQIQDSLAINASIPKGEVVLWEIFNTRGEQVLSGHFPAGTSFPVSIDTKGLPPGGYVLNVIVKDRPHAFKLTKLLKASRPE